MDINDVDYLMTSRDHLVQECYASLKQLGIRDISDMHKTGRFNIPLQGNTLQIGKEIGRLQKYVAHKKEEAVKEKGISIIERSMGKGNPENEEKDSSARGMRGYSTPVNSPTEMANDTMNMIELGDSYICLLYTSPSPRDRTRSRMPSSA